MFFCFLYQGLCWVTRWHHSFCSLSKYFHTRQSRCAALALATLPSPALRQQHSYSALHLAKARALRCVVLPDAQYSAVLGRDERRWGLPRTRRDLSETCEARLWPMANGQGLRGTNQECIYIYIYIYTAISGPPKAGHKTKTKRADWNERPHFERYGFLKALK